MTTLDVTRKEGRKTEQELRTQREKIYCKPTQARPLHTAGDRLAPMDHHLSNFNRWIKQNFVMGRDVFSERYPNS